MTRIRVLTTFGRRQWEEYAHALLPRSLALWPPEVEWQIWLDNDCDGTRELVEAVPGLQPVSLHYLSGDPDHQRFIEWWERLCEKRGQPASYLWDAGRFAHKVFALTHPAARTDVDWLIFLGADVETLKPVDMAWLESFLRGDLIHLGRVDMRSSETDFLAIRVPSFSWSAGDEPWGYRFLCALRHIYTTGDVYNGAEWIDGYVTARLVRVFEALGAEVVNLSEGLRGLNVFEHSVLGERLFHHKGPGGKAKLKEALANGA